MNQIKNFTIALVSLVLILSCDTGADVPESSSAFSIPESLEGAYFEGKPLPMGTSYDLSQDKRTIFLEFPESISMVRQFQDGRITWNSSSKYTCTGDCSSGCDVIYVGGQFGCSQCNPSTVTCTGSSGGGGSTYSFGYLDVKNELRILDDASDLQRDFSEPEFFFDIPEVQRVMLDFNKTNYGEERPDFSAFETVPIYLKVFGVPVIYQYPKHLMDKFSQGRVSTTFMVAGEDFSCDCEDVPDPGGCTKKSGLGYDSCISGACVSCTMTVGGDDPSR